MPSLTFVAAANALLGTINTEPYFLDSNKSNYGICSKDLEDTLKKNVIFKKGRPYCKITKKSFSYISCSRIWLCS